MHPTGYPDFPMPQSMRTENGDRRVIVSCLVSDLRFEWSLEDLGDGRGTRIGVHVDVPDPEAHRLEGQRDDIRASLTELAAVAAASGPAT